MRLQAVLFPSDAWRQARFAESGEIVPAVVVVEVPAGEISAESRKQLAAWSPQFWPLVFKIPPDTRLCDLERTQRDSSCWQAPFVPVSGAEWDALIAQYAQAIRDAADKHRRELQERMSCRLTELRETARQIQADPLAFARKHRYFSKPGPSPYLSAADKPKLPHLDGYAEAVELAEAIHAAYAKARAEVDEAERIEREAMIATERAERERLDAEKRDWIARHGSDYLRRACGAGYDCQRKYVLERGALEHPGYTLDFEEAAAWKARSCPSERALAEAERVGGTVVWLTAPPRDTPPANDYEVDYDEFEQGEAVVIRGFLGKYGLVRQL